MGYNRCRELSEDTVIGVKLGHKLMNSYTSNINESRDALLNSSQLEEENNGLLFSTTFVSSESANMVVIFCKSVMG